ncbi:MAG: hypothetical protein JRM99_06820 [Nitrososphaerota archaeon]|nr:hypothetical protein [Nitrososphaerota archaeon]
MTREPSVPALKVAVLGAINWDTTAFERDFAAPGEEVPVARLEEFPGGKGANTAVAAARILGSGAVAFLGALGNDQVKPSLLASLSSEGVRTDGVQVVEGASSGRAFIVVDGSGAKTIHTHFGANDRYTPEHVRSPKSSALLAGASAAVIMDVPLDASAAAAEIASSRSKVIFSPGVRASGPARALSGLLSVADDLVVDRSELAKLSGRNDPREGVEALHKKHAGVTIVATLGPDGCLVARDGKTTRVPPVRLAGLGLTAVNSTGSGDAFLAAYACYSLMGASPEEAAGWGNLAGALNAASAETRGSPTRAALEEKMLLLRAKRRG